jgi:KDO2-lipid IV(A) lauroyltransferase
VLSNLRNSFPEKDESEIRSISKKFYQQFCDVMLELLKSFSLSDKEAKKRITVTNPELLDELYGKGKSVIITGGHYCNWETITITANRMKHDMYGLFTPISNKFLEGKVTKSRSRFGFNMVSTKKYKASLMEEYERPRAYVFAVDQAPRAGSGHWMQFLNQETAVLFGTEKTAKEFDMVIVAGLMERARRGRYTLTYELLVENPKETKETEITEKCMKRVEQQIIANPHNWLWTHRRWKHKRHMSS